MEDAEGFLANYHRNSPYAPNRDVRTPYASRPSHFGSTAFTSHNVPQQQSAYFGHSGIAQGPLFEAQSLESESPLDDFDRQLLRETQSHHRHPETSVLGRVSLPSKSSATPLMTSNTRRLVQDDLHDNVMPPSSSSSPCAPVTSPTVSVLQNRLRGRTGAPLRNTTSTFRYENRSNENRADTQNAAPIVNKHTNQRPPLQVKSPSSTSPVIQGIQLVPSTALPDQLRSVFNFDIFNAVQSKCFPSAFRSDDNLVVSAPTGSGKTVIMELAICRLVAESKGQDFKVIYQAPTKSLCAERYIDWQKKFSVLNLECAELTGDTDFGQLRNVQKAGIIITTPEKWDSVTRKWKDHARLMQLVKLFLVDEVHILKDERGATLEAVVSRMKSVVSNIRFVTLSATVPNSEDIAIWLGKNSTTQHLPARREVFGESFRPVQLKKHVYGFEARGNDFAFESMLTQQIPEIITNHGRGKPVMVFCSTRKASAATAKVLAEMWSNAHPMQRPWKGPDGQLSLSSPELKAVALTGVAFHHGGLSPADRRAVEQAFLQGRINIICSTSTLAVGVNLPCYLVILKGTCAWTDTGFKELADLEVMQMLGRAGRPQFETSACAVILCRKEKVPRYEKMVSGDELLESCLHQNLIEHLNAEIVLGTVHDVPTAKQWLASTFLYVRLKKNPAHYQFREGVEDSRDEELLEQLCRKDIDLLLRAGIVEEKGHLVSTMFGEAMARYCVSFETMKSFIALPPKAKMSELLSLLAQAREFREVRMQAGEKSFYKEINKAPEIKFPIKVDIALPAHKISLLMQAELGNVALPDGENYKKHHQQYRIDRSGVFIHANRLVRCLIDCQIQLQDAISARHALELGRSLAVHVWDNTASQLRQVDGLGEVAVRKLAAASINSIDTLLSTEPSRIELVLGKNPPFGHQLLKKLESFPNLRVSVKEARREIRVGKGVSIEVIAEIGFLNEVPPQLFSKKAFSVCFLAEDSHGTLIDFRRFGPKKLERGEQVYLTLHLTKPTSHVNCYVMCDDIAGTSKYAELKLSDIPTSMYPVAPAKDDLPGANRKHNRDVTADTDFDNDFDDGGIDDLDLLAADVDGSRIEVIEDTDTILETADRKKVSTPTNQLGEDVDAPAYREPTQLPNGRWTCQHDCNDRNKQCKHKCCQEGASRPKRRPKLEPKVKEDEKGQKKLTAMASMQPKVKTGPKSKSKSETKVPTKFTDAPTTKTKNSHSRKRTRSLEGPHLARSRSCSSISMSNHEAHTDNPAGKRSRLSKDRTSDFWGEEPDIRGFDSEAEPALSVKGLRQAPLKRPAAKATTAEHDGFLSYDEDDFFDFSLAETGNPNGQHAVAGQQGLTQDTLSPNEPGVHEKDFTTPDEDNFDLSTWDIDLGGFEPPVKHVAMSDVLKKNRGPADAQSSDAVENSDCLRDDMDFDDEFTGASCDFIGELADQEQHVEDASSVPDFVNGNAYTPAESPVKTPGENEPDGTVQGGLRVNIDVYANETEDERKKRRYEEDQKKKWEGIDQWLYDEFHEYVELV